jgi:hypothetical protein
VEHAFIFGSWARRCAGEPGPLPRDVDALVVGSSDPEDVYRAVRSVEDRVGMEVNPVLIAADEWEASGGLVARVRREPLFALDIPRADDR